MIYYRAMKPVSQMKSLMGMNYMLENRNRVA